MSLFVVRHRHTPERCPAGNPEAASFLLSHLSPGNAGKHGITLHSEAVIDGGHTLYVIAEAASRAAVESYMQPFAQAGEVEIQQASHCEQVVERKSC